MHNNSNSGTADEPLLNELITLQEAVQLCGLTQPHLALLVRRGLLWGKKIGRDWVTTRQAIIQYQAFEHKPGPKTKKR